MPRQSKTDRLLEQRERMLTEQVAKAVAEAERLGGVLKEVRDLRVNLKDAAPKRTRKRLVPANTQPATATAA